CAKRPACLPKPGPMVVLCPKCNCRDEYGPDGPWDCTNECGQRHVLGPVQEDEPEKPKPRRRRKKAPEKKAEPQGIQATDLYGILVKGDTPMPLATIETWNQDQRKHAWAYGAEVHAYMEEKCDNIATPRPSFIPDYGDPDERKKHGMEDEPPETIGAEEASSDAQPDLDFPDPQSVCPFAFDDGGACGREKGHPGEHERL
ncbi:unnamed protein product, partial [marine sediment metagenome]